MHVSAPASSANLGPGFDCLALALDLPFELSDSPAHHALDGQGWHVVESTHPAAVAYVAAGGDADAQLSWRSPIPPGRGLGFSGAARVAGAYLALLTSGAHRTAAQQQAFGVAANLEGHADNAAASTWGGFTVAAGEQALSLKVPEGLEMVVWWPEKSTSTNASRSVLAPTLSREAAAFSIARSSLWVAAIATGDLSKLRVACEDQVHQNERLLARPDSAEVLQELLANQQVLAAWLSGSGPTVAALMPVGSSAGLLAPKLFESGRTRVLAVSATGVNRVSSTSNT
ncbi:MAG: homoserine kinase [Actinobacteria bacterium]|nr:homoserine kinase [Actinomycetota bacterium]